jgi:hypothetical protein
LFKRIYFKLRVMNKGKITLLNKYLNVLKNYNFGMLIHTMGNLKIARDKAVQMRFLRGLTDGQW